MTTITLQKGAAKINDLSNVLTALLDKPTLCSTELCCSLFSKYLRRVTSHLATVETTIYSRLLISSDSHHGRSANNFLEGAVEIKRIIKQHQHKWCTLSESSAKPPLEHDQFAQESLSLYALVSKRLNDEEVNLYPLLGSMHIKDFQFKKAA